MTPIAPISSTSDGNAVRSDDRNTAVGPAESALLSRAFVVKVNRLWRF